MPVVPPPSYDVVYRDDAREIISIGPARVKATYARLTLSWISALWQALQKSAKGEMPLRQSTSLRERVTRIDHCNSADPSVGAFVDAYNRNAHRWAIQASADTDAVEVMTIHSSKGLERPCVHIRAVIIASAAAAP